MSSPLREKSESFPEEIYKAGEGTVVPTSSYSEHSLSSIASHDEYFKSRYHSDSTLSKMHLYLANDQLTDVTLVAGSRRIPAHRLVLSAASEYFFAMFTSDLREASQKEIVLQDVDGDALNELVQYCYTGKIELKEDTVETLLGTASLLRLLQVVEACCVFLKRQLHPSNCLGIYLYADSQGCVELRDSALNYTMDHFMDVIKNQEFLMLPATEVAKLLKSDNLNVTDEEAIFNCVMQWVNFDKENRSCDVGKLLSLVKLPLLPPSFLADYIDVDGILREDETCIQLFLEAFKYHALPERRIKLQNDRTRPRKSTVGVLYSVGGMEANRARATTIEEYNLLEDSWSQVGQMPGRRLQFGVAVLNSKLFVVGGRDGLKTLNTVECFDLVTKTWSSVTPMSTHRHGLGVAVLEGPLYAVGGHDGWSYLNSVERWDPQLKEWSFVAPMLQQRSTVGVAVLNNKLYAVGGRDGCACLKTVECYDPHTNKWTMCAPMAKRRGSVGVAVMNGYLYALGGHDVPTVNPSSARYDCVERYDPISDSWTTIASMSVGRDGIGVGLLGDRLFAVGGYDGMRYLRLVEAYDPQTNTWTQVSSMNVGRAGLCVAVVQNPPRAISST